MATKGILIPYCVDEGTFGIVEEPSEAHYTVPIIEAHINSAAEQLQRLFEIDGHYQLHPLAKRDRGG